MVVTTILAVTTYIFTYYETNGSIVPLQEAFDHGNTIRAMSLGDSNFVFSTVAQRGNELDVGVFVYQRQTADQQCTLVQHLNNSDGH